MPGSQSKHSPTQVPEAETSTHLESAASASHRGAAASLVGQSELHGGLVAKQANTISCRCLVGVPESTLPLKCQRQRRAHILSPPPPPLVDQSELHGGSVAKQANTISCRCLVHKASTLPLKCQRQRRARTLSPPPPPRTVEQLQAWSVSRSCMAAWLQSKQTPSAAGAWFTKQALSHSSARGRDEHAP